MDSTVRLTVVPFFNLIGPSKNIIFNGCIGIAYLILKAGDNIVGIGGPCIFVYAAK